MDTTDDTQRAVERAAAKVARAEEALSAALLAAADQGMTYEALGQLTGWDRRTVSRELAKLRERYHYKAHRVRPGQVDFVLITREGDDVVTAVLIDLKHGTKGGK